MICTELTPVDQLSLQLFEHDRWVRSRELMRAVDQINARHGREAVRYGAAGDGRSRRQPQQRWRTKFEQRSPRYTTGWKELPLVKA